MATTSRESTASFHSGLIPLPSSAYGHRISTAADPTCQEVNPLALPIGEPLISCVLWLVETALELHFRTNGATVSLSQGNMAGRKLFAVSIYPERTVKLSVQPSRHNLFAFVVANLALLLMPGRALGTWFDDRDGVHVLDVVVCLSDRHAALKLGSLFRQWSIFDLSTCRELRIGEPASLLRPSSTEARP